MSDKQVEKIIVNGIRKVNGRTMIDGLAVSKLNKAGISLHFMPEGIRWRRN